MVANVVQSDARRGKRDRSERNSFFHLTEEHLQFILECAQKELTRRARIKRKIEDKEAAAAQKSERNDDGSVAFVSSPLSDVRLPRSLRPEILKRGPNDFTKYIPSLLQQEWSYLWNIGDTRKRYCVYAHVDPNGKGLNTPRSIGGQMRQPFYIGKGTIERAYNLERNQGHGIRLKQLLDSGMERTEIVKILRSGLDEQAAFELEAKLIYFFGTVYEKNRKGLLLNLDIPHVPDFRGVMKQIHFIDHYSIAMARKTKKEQAA